MSKRQVSKGKPKDQVRRDRQANPQPRSSCSSTAKSEECSGLLPLYTLANGAPWSSKPPVSANLGLWHEKFFNRWKNSKAGDRLEATGEDKTKWLEEVVSAAETNTSSIQVHLEEHRQRIEALVRNWGGRAGLFRSIDRLVTGIGRPHPVENGFSFHHLLGVPYLPGSSLKGVVRSWAEEIEEADSNWLFGSPNQVGACELLDVLPIKPPDLVVEVLTPHYGGWTPDNPPGDWCRPVPVSYLAVESGVEFLVAVVARRRGDKQVVEQAWEILVRALRNQGVGAHTSLGFGRLELISELTDSAATLLGESAESISASPVDGGGKEARGPEGRWRAELRGKNAQAVYESALKMANSDEAERDELAAMVAVLEELGYLSAWRSGRKFATETTGPKKLRELASRLDRSYGSLPSLLEPHQGR